jgi:hypothetical protein
MNYTSGKKHDWQTEPFIIESIIALCKANGITAIWEIGTFKGDSALAFRDAGFRVVTSDVEVHVEKHQQDISYIIGNAPVINQNIAGMLLGEKVAVFIDGDHTYNGVSSDFKACEAVGLNELIFLHDAKNRGCMGVNQFINEQTGNKYYYTMILETVDATGLGIVCRRR